MFFTLFSFIKSEERLQFNDVDSSIFPEPVIIPEYSNLTRRTLDEEWKNIRIKLNMSYITGEVRDEYMCYEEGQIIQFKDANENLTCTKELLFSSKDYSNLTIIVQNLKKFGERFLKILPSPNKDYDMELTVKLVYFASTDNAVAKARVTSLNEYLRPTAATITLDAYGLSFPTIPEYETELNGNSKTLIHEFIHTTYALQGRYHPRNSKEFYTEDQMYCTLTKYGKEFKFLVTPHSHLFAQKHYGVDEFVGDDKTCPSGIEVEDGGGKGTKNVHLKGLTFFGEVITGTGPLIRLTDASIAIIQDTGNYICNWSMAQPLVWGNRESQIGGKPIKDFAIGPPQLVYPENYLYDENKRGYVGFDFKHGGGSRSIQAPTNCNSNPTWKKYCDAKQYYNPLNLPKITYDDIFNYVNYREPIDFCKKGEAMIPGDGICHPYICDKYNSFTLITPEYGDIEGNFTNITCTKDDPNKTITLKLPGITDEYKNVTCVHPELFCRSVKLSDMHFVRDPFDPNMSVTQLDDPYLESSTKEETNTTSDSESDSKSNSNNKIKIIVPCVVCGVIVIAIIVIVTIFIIKKRKSNEDNDYGHNTEDVNKSHGKRDIEKGLAQNSADNFLSD